MVGFQAFMNAHRNSSSGGSFLLVHLNQVYNCKGDFTAPLPLPDLDCPGCLLERRQTKTGGVVIWLDNYNREGGMLFLSYRLYRDLPKRSSSNVDFSLLSWIICAKVGSILHRDDQLTKILETHHSLLRPPESTIRALRRDYVLSFPFLHRESRITYISA